jgi:hypothetical protein
MKTQIIERPVAIQAGQSQEFTIKANGKAFRALISTLYENKIQSIVREIWSNALDSHMNAGIEDRPFLVTFPTVFNPTFIVRDFGTSLEHDEVMKLYTTVFESTKEDDEDATGKFGLGSKSPFAYTDTFSVVAIKGGMKRHYSAVIGTNGIPSIHFLGEHETDEEQGVEVSFPIQSNDINKFRRAAKRVSHGFEVKPEVLRAEEEDEFEGWPELSTLLEGDGWKILNGYIEGYSAQAYAKMGPVLYPINVNAIEDLNAEERQLLQTTILIDFKMGELEMTPSREALSYGNDEPTIPSIRNRVRTIVREMVDGYQDRYDACSTYWEACAQFALDVGASNGPRPVKTALEKTASWNGEPLKTAMKLESYEIGPDAEFCVLSGDKRHGKVLRFSEQTSTEISFSASVITFVEDIHNDKRAAARIKHHLENMAHMPKYVYWIKSRTQYLRAKKAPKIDLLELLDGTEILLVDDLDFPPKVSYGSGGGYRAPAMVRQMDYDGDFDIKVSLTSEEEDAGGYYIPLERNEPQYPSHMRSPKYMFNALRAFGTIPDNAVLYGAPKTLWKRFEGDNWINIYDIAEEAFDKSQPKASVAKAAMIDAVQRSSDLRFLRENLNVKTLEGPGGAALEAFEYYKRIEGLTKPDTSAYRNLATCVGKTDHIEEWSKFDDTELEYHKLCVEEAYPLLGMIRRRCNYEDKLVDKVTHYVQVCDMAASYDSQDEITIAA